LEKQIALVEVWLGKIPDYFKYHIETIGSMTCVDFHFLTNDKDYDFSYIKHPNFIGCYISEEEFLERFNNTSNVKIDKISHPKKIIDFKLAYFDMFQDLIGEYPYVGIYDVDTMFGDINPLLLEYTKEYDFISVGDEVYHNRLSGPLLIMKNTEELRSLMRTDRYYETLKMDDIYGYGEQELSTIAMSNYKTKIIHSMNTEVNNGGKTTYNVCWSGGKLNVNDEEKMIYHFYRKGHTVFNRVGNKIYGRYDKKFVDDFYWVFGFTENYSSTVKYLMESIHNYSNRKCIIYTINFNYELPEKFVTSEQFILRRIDIEEGKKDHRGRDENIISSKPKLMIDVVNHYPNNKFIFIDSDCYLTVAADNISSYFKNIGNYPLINSHIHDRLYLCNIREGEDWTSTIDILADKVGVEVCVYPRRKTNVILFNDRCKWFFEEQIKMYDEYKDSEIGIFTLHDEDSANIVLSKYKMHNNIHLCDIEETADIEMEKFTNLNHPFHMTGISEFVKLPKHQNDITVFHGLKTKERFDEIQKVYGNTVLDCEELLVTYSNNTILFEKNSFLSSKKINENVDFIISDLNGNIIEKLENQQLMNYWVFYISNVFLDQKTYIIEVIKTNSKIKIYNNLLTIQ
jgi:hypothetical protein